jgi:LuxR family maltose regulon positive regulatory protein
MAMYGGRIGEAEELLDAAERAPTSPVEEPFEPSVGTSASPLVNVPGTIAGLRAFGAHMRGEADEATALASRIIAETGDEEWVLARIAHWHMATAEWLRGEAAAAERAVTADLAEWRAAGQHDRAAWSSHYLGRIQRARGHLNAALGTYRRVLEVDVTGSRRRFAPGAGVALVGMAEVSYERNELDLARHHATEGIALCRQFLYSQALATGLSTLARIRQVEGDPDGARTTIEEAVRVGPSSETVDLLNPVPAQWARLLLTQGDIAAAARWAAERGVDVDEEPLYVHEPAYLVLARVLLAQERFDLALPLLHRLYVAATTQGRVGSIIEVQMLRALAHAAEGEETDAVAALAESLTLGHTEGYARIFVDEGPPMATLLGRLIATQSAEGASSPSIPFGYLSRLVRMFEEAAAGSAAGPTMKSPAGVRLVTPLSDRELEVLRLMATGRQNQEIAREIYVSLNTVKKHVTHILEKLGAANRTEATSRARQLGLLLDGEPSHVRDGSRSPG